MNSDPRLSRIETLWSVVRQAHEEDSGANVAQKQLLDRYGGAVRQYLLGALRSEEAADEVFQEFALRFVRGDFRNAEPGRGRFRSFVKTAVYHLIVDFQRRAKRNRQQPLDAVPGQEPSDQPMLDDLDKEFTASWRQELLAKTWSMLQTWEAKNSKPYYTVLKFRAEHPTMRSPELAEEFSSLLARSVSSANARVLVHRARERFAELLIDAVQESLSDDSREELEDELIALDLLNYCRPALDKRRNN